MGVAHGRLNPNNILIFKDRDNGLRAKLSHFCCSSSGTPGWLSPEQVKGQQGDMSSDKYVLGLLLSYCMIGEHLMGNFMSFDRYGEMNANDASLCKEIIKAKALRLPHLETKLIPEAISLVQGLMTNKPEDRLSLKTLGLEHPIFWSNFKRARLICEKHNWLKHSKNSHAVTYLDTTKKGDILKGVDWRKHINKKLCDKYKENKIKQKNQEALSSSVVGGSPAVSGSSVGSSVVSGSVTSLIWFIRNVTQHFKDYEDEFKGVGVKNVGEAWSYFLVRFPNLVVECFNYVKNHLLDNEQFEDFLLPLQG
ncbi:serine/threonine-protein kinase/endoribonuclease IRE1a [Trifolium repens]|nr:serine/threonine-protein kinase/endoribonuclease IRE1a [Trifolium repens]